VDDASGEILRLRPAKHPVDPWHAHAALWEEEPDAAGVLVPTAVVFLTNRECPFRCVMCDLWTHTLDTRVPDGAVAAQVREALSGLPAARQVKLYNAGSYFDPQAVPVADDAAVADALATAERVIVESHPAFLAGAHGERCLRFRDRLAGRLEVAIGLETADPAVLARLNKRMTLDGFRRAAAFLRRHDVDLRVFILLGPPFAPPEDAVLWAGRSIDLAAECGATACTVIPTRGGNGAMEAPGASFVPPRLTALEAAVEYGLARGGLRVFADLWDVERLFDCACAPARADRLRRMNREQHAPAPVVCGCAGGDRDRRH
jgi:uncharacterized Fe-S cluster-containing MiaB family protein